MDYSNNVLTTFTFSHLADAFIQSDLQLGVHKSRRGKHTEEVPITPSLRHCSNKYMLAREGEKDEDFEKVKVQFFFFLSSQVEFLTNFKNILICVPKINEGLVGFERHEGE